MLWLLISGKKKGLYDYCKFIYVIISDAVLWFTVFKSTKQVLNYCLNYLQWIKIREFFFLIFTIFIITEFKNIYKDIRNFYINILYFPKKTRKYGIIFIINIINIGIIS